MKAKIKTKFITPEEYATTMIARKGPFKGEHVSVEYIQMFLNKGEKLPHIISVKNHGRFYLIEVPETLKIGTYNKSRKRPSLSTK